MNKQVLFVEYIGKLSSVYRYADLAYIGEGLGVGIGIHNTMEVLLSDIEKRKNRCRLH